jgi:starch-binding outer membrane protein, SusD/RagB family
MLRCNVENTEHMRTLSNHTNRGVRRLVITMAALMLLPISACKDILSVDLPTRVPDAALGDPALASVLVQGAIADFECALANYTTATGLLTDELIDATGWIAVTMWDQRRIFPDNGNLGTSNCTTLGYGVYTPLQTARFQAADVARRLTGFADADVPNKSTLLATVAAIEGYAITLLGEGFCEIAIDGGPGMTRAQSLALAETRFTTAIGLATTAGAQDILNLARVGRARVRLDLGKLAEAAADADLVPAGFVYNATYSSTNDRRRNRIFFDGQTNLYLSVDPRFRNLTVGGVADPRVKVAASTRNGHDGITPLWLQQKYTSDAAPIAIASWREARLISAEAKGGQPAVDAINLLRAASSLPTFSSTDANEIKAQVIEERRRELFLDGHRLNDMLRLNLPFDTGTTFKGVPYGDTKCLPLPDAERLANPNFTP